MLVEQYIEVETPKKIVKPVSQARFSSNYDINDLLTEWGNWSRKDYYIEQKTPSFYYNQKSKHKKICSDEDALLIENILTSLAKINKNGADQFNVLKLFYFGCELTIEEYVASTGCTRNLAELAKKGLVSIICARDFKEQTKKIIRPLTVIDIARKLKIDRSKVKFLKNGGENHVLGHLCAIKPLEKGA